MFGLHSADIIFHLAWALVLIVIALPMAAIWWTLNRVDRGHPRRSAEKASWSAAF